MAKQPKAANRTQRLGQRPKPSPFRRVLAVGITAVIVSLVGFAAYRATRKTTVEVPVARVRRGEFVVSVIVRGEVKSSNPVVLTAPQVPDLQIVRLARDGQRVRKGDVVVEFDSAAQEQALLQQTTTLRTIESQIVQLLAQHKIVDEQDEMNLMTAQYNLERAKLDASKAEVISAIEGAKYRIDVGIYEGELNQVKTIIRSHDVAQEADLQRLQRQREKAIRDLERIKSYLSQMVIRAPIDGYVHLLPNFRASGSFGSRPPAFKEGDTAWTGAAIAEIPDLSKMHVEINLDEVDRGRVQVGMPVRVRVDAIPDREFPAQLDWISPVATAQTGTSAGATEKTFLARATLSKLDERLRPGMSASAEIIIRKLSNVLIIPARASFLREGTPAVYVQQGEQFRLRFIKVGERNDRELVVLSGLSEGEIVALENPVEAAKRARKL